MIKGYSMNSRRGRGRSSDFSGWELPDTYDEDNELHTDCLCSARVISYILSTQNCHHVACYVNDRSTKAINNDANVLFRKTKRNLYTVYP